MRGLNALDRPALVELATKYTDSRRVSELEALRNIEIRWHIRNIRLCACAWSEVRYPATPLRRVAPSRRDRKGKR